MNATAKRKHNQEQMPSPPKPRSRKKTGEELKLAMLRVENKGLKLSISAVATEAGVTPGLIHNTYPDIAEAIRAKVGRGIRQLRDDKAAELADAKKRLREISNERDAALADLAKIASIAEALRTELAILRASATANVVILPQRIKR